MKATKIIEVEPGAAWPHDLKALMLSRFGREDRARAERAAADALRPASRSEHDVYFAGLMALEQGDDDRALELFSELIVVRPNDPEAAALRAQAQERLGELDDAVLDYRSASALAPQDFAHPFNIGRLYQLKGDLEASRRYLTRAQELEPEHGIVYEGLSDNSLARGRDMLYAGDPENARVEFERAEQEARRALALDPDLPAGHLNLGASLVEQTRLSGFRTGRTP